MTDIKRETHGVVVVVLWVLTKHFRLDTGRREVRWLELHAD